MDVGVFLSVVEMVGNDLLAVAISEKVDRTCGNNANKCRTKTLEQCTRRLVAVDITVKKGGGSQSRRAAKRERLYVPKNMASLHEIPQ